MKDVAYSDRVLFRHVLLATDFSSSSTPAALHAVSFARLYEASLSIAHILPPDAPTAAADDAWRAGQRLETELLVGGHLRGVQHKLFVRSGEIWEGLARLISEEGVDLIVVGTRGRTGLARVLLGSVAERIFRRATCPVLTVGTRTAGSGAELAIRHVLYATDFSPHSLEGLSYANSLANRSGGSLTLLHIVAEISAGAALSKESHLEKGRLQLQEMIRTSPVLGEPHLVVGFGSPATRILAVAAEQHADLIVLGLRQAKEQLASRRWTTASEVTAKANCGVLTVRAATGT